jgi:cytochrome b pre-mRNA-processing protein 3
MLIAQDAHARLAGTTRMKGIAMVFGLFAGKAKPPASVDRVYADTVKMARRPSLYSDMGVPDTVMGRFDCLALHLSLVLRRLKALPAPADQLAQELVDRFFADLDDALREIGIGDVSVPKKVKALGKAFYGRLQSYDAALTSEAPILALDESLARNVLERPGQPAFASLLAAEVRRQAARLDSASFDDILAGIVLEKGVS